jgi:hypothetical protein
MNATRALYDLVYGSYKCFKKCNATLHTLCTYTILWLELRWEGGAFFPTKKTHPHPFYIIFLMRKKMGEIGSSPTKKDYLFKKTCKLLSAKKDDL